MASPLFFFSTFPVFLSPPVLYFSSPRSFLNRTIISCPNTCRFPSAYFHSQPPFHPSITLCISNGMVWFLSPLVYHLPPQLRLNLRVYSFYVSSLRSHTTLPRSILPLCFVRPTGRDVAQHTAARNSRSSIGKCTAQAGN